VGVALVATSLTAQNRPVPATRAPADSARPAADSLGARVPLPSDTVPAKDSVKAPYAAAESPRGATWRGRQYVWTRETMFVTGAHNVAELVAEVPGVTSFRSSYLMSPMVTAWYGEPGRVRVFFDGLEVDALDPRMGGQLDLAALPLYGLEEVAVERAATELRIYLRSWRTEATAAQTRVDVGTGAENYTLYRGYYAKRLQNGGGLQLAGQQFSVFNGITGGDGESFSTIARLGWAGGDWSVDALGSSVGRVRAATRRYVRTTPDEAAIAPFEGSERFGYLRVGYRQPEADGVWVQALASAQLYLERDSLAAADSVPDPDTLRSQTQFLLTGGVNRGPLQLSAAARYRVRGGAGRLAPSLRAAYRRERVEVSAFAELDGPDSTRRVDLAARVDPLRWLHLAVSAGQQAPHSAAVQGPARSTLRAELGLSWRERWISAGALQRSAAQVAGMPVFDSLYGAVALPDAQGLFVAAGGPLWGPFALDVFATDWGDEQLYRPRHQVRSVLRVETNLRRWLERDTFLMRASFIHEYRSDLLAPDGAGGVVRAKGTGVPSLLLDIRLGSAHIFFHNRNFAGEVYETVPGYLMPRLIQQYGVRWDFWN
jgi:hypothetical protein